MNSAKAPKTSVAKQFFKLMFLSGAIFITTLLFIILLIAWFQRNHILEQFSQQLQQHLNVDVKVEALEFGLVRSFPMASVTATGVQLQSGKPSDAVFLHAEANNIQLNFNILDIFRKEYHVQRLIIRNGNINTSFGQDILNLQEPDNRNGYNNLYFDLRRLYLYDMEINFTSPNQGENHHIVIQEMRLSGSMAKDSKWTVAKSSIFFKSHLFEVSGTFFPDDEGVLVNATLKGSNFCVKSILNELPKEVADLFRPYEPAGNVDFISKVNGTIGLNDTPFITTDFEITRGSFVHPAKRLMLSHINLKGNYSNGVHKTLASSSIKLKDVSANTESGRIGGTVSIENLQQPLLGFNLLADVSATDFVGWTGINTINVTNGKVKADLSFSGMMNSDMGFSGKDLLASNFKGSLWFRDLSFVRINNPLDYHDFSGTFHVGKDQTLLVEELSGRMGQSDIAVSGTAYNLLPFMFIPNEVLYVDARMTSETLLLDELLMTTDQGGEQNRYRISFSEFLNLSLNANVRHLKFRRFFATDIEAHTTLFNQQLHAEKLAFNAMDGRALMTGGIDASNNEDIKLNTRADLQNVDIHQLFYQTGNFGQTSIVEENIFGQVTADVDFYATWTPELKIKWNSMVASASLTIDNGMLINYQPMQALGRFVRAGDLSNVDFSTLKNEIYIRDEMVFIPMMEIDSNVLDLELTGQHSFGNEIDYRLRVELSELFSRRHREGRNPQEQFGEVIDDGLGRTTLFLKLTGTTQNVAVRYDQEGLKDKLREDLKEERQNLRDIMREEFRFLSRQPADTTTSNNGRQKERDRIRKQEEEGFIIEWD